MTIKKAIAIGLLTSTVVGLLALGIKFNLINKQNTHTQVKADDINHQKELDENIDLPMTKAVTETVYWKQSLNNTYYTYRTNPTSIIYIPNQLAVSYVNYEFNRYHITGKLFFLTTQNSTTYRLFSDTNQTQFTIDLYTTEVSPTPNLTQPFQFGFSNIALAHNWGTNYNLQIRFTIYQNNQQQTYGTTYNHTAYIYDSNFNIVENAQASSQFNLTAWNSLITNTAPVTPTVTNEVIPIHNLMLQILTMPFTFITQAFDVTLWPGTNYAFNIKSFIMGLIAIASILFIIKLFTSGFAIIGNYTHSSTDTKLKKSQIEYNKAKTDLARRTDPNTKTTKIKKEK